MGGCLGWSVLNGGVDWLSLWIWTAFRFWVLIVGGFVVVG